MAYTYNNGVWNLIDDGIKQISHLHQVRKKMGFEQKRDLECITGSAKLYSRSNSAKDGKYPHLVILECASVTYWVWITDLPSVFQFLNEIQAKYKEPVSYGDPVTNILEYLQDSYFSSAMKRLYEYLDRKDS